MGADFVPREAVSFGLSYEDETCTPVPPVIQLPTVVNEFQRATVDGRYALTSHLAAGGVYWYDSYRVND